MNKQKLLDWARYYTGKGISVIPIKSKDKTPAIPSWKEYQNRLPTDEELIKWFGNSSKNNIGIVTGRISGIVAVDLDNQRAVEFAKANNFPESPLSKTGKGFHLIYRYKEGIRNFQKRDDLPDIDLRGEGGYILVEPSIHPSGHQYQWVKGKGLDDVPIAEIPEIILAKNPQDKTPLRELYRGVEQGLRNDSLTRIIGSLVNDDLTFSECLEFACLWNQKNNPPLPEKEIERTVKSIFEKHREKQHFETPKDLLSSLLKWNEIATLNVQTEYLLQNLIPKGSITLLFGRGGIGKTSLSLQIARAIAEGVPFGGLQTIKTSVYFIDFENPLSILKERVEKIGQADNLWVWHISNNPMPPRLDSLQWELYKKLPPGLLIFDTLRASHLSDENNSQDMAIVISRLKELREMGFTILLLHHTPKGNEGIYKGSTALLDLVDHCLGLEELKKGDESIEFDAENIYRLGVRIKTRYEPHYIFLKFNPDIKGFEVAKDPDYEVIEAIHELLKDKNELNTNQVYELVKKELDIKSKAQVLKLLKKGEGKYWNTEKRGRAVFYSPIVQPIYSQTLRPINENGLISVKKNNQQSLDNPIKSNSPEGIQTNEPIFVDTEVEL